MIISAQAPKTTPPTCPVCGSLLSIVTWTCVRGDRCKPPAAKPDVSSSNREHPMNRERPILFSAPMVRAILDGRKTQTRRVVKGDKPGQALDLLNEGFTADYVAHEENGLCPYGVAGDRLWVREAWTKVPATAYQMSEGVQQTICPDDTYWAAIYAAGWDRSIPKWKPSIHMPRWASRITLEITGVRVERLQEISYDDCAAEGVICDIHGTTKHTACSGLRRAYEKLWRDINGDASWDENPWVWVVEFPRIETATAAAA